MIDSFNAKYKDGKIYIVSNTHWSAAINGTLMLSQYSGVGNKVVDVLISTDISFGSGDVYFSYGDGYCTDYPQLHIGLENKDYFKVVPNYVCLNGKGSTATATIFSNNGYMVNGATQKNYSVLPYGSDKVLIISNTDKDFGCEGDVSFFVDDLKHPNRARVKVYQCVENELNDTCILYATYSKINANVFNVNVESILKGEYSVFTWDSIEGVSITKTNANTLNVVINNVVGDAITLNLHNECSDYDLTIYKENTTYSSIFDVAVKCNGLVSMEGGETEVSIASQTIGEGDDFNKIKEQNQLISLSCDGDDDNTNNEGGDEEEVLIGEVNAYLIVIEERNI